MGSTVYVVGMYIARFYTAHSSVGYPLFLQLKDKSERPV